MNSVITRYIKDKIKYPLLIEAIPAEDLKMIFVIPCCNESKIIETVRSIYLATPPQFSIEIIVVIYADRNDQEHIHTQNILSDKELHEINDLPEWCKLYVIMNNNFTHGKANANFAAKIGMDDAVRRFSHMDNENGLIIRHNSHQFLNKDFLTTIEEQSDEANQNYPNVIRYCESK